MSKYKIFESDQFLSDLDNLPKIYRIGIEKKLREYIYPQLKENPQNGLNIKKLRNYNPETWRYRIGNYRMFYEIDFELMIVVIISIEQRKDAY